MIARLIRISALVVLLLMAAGACDSKNVDGTNLRGVFDTSPRSTSSASAAASGSAKAAASASAKAAASAAAPVVHVRERRPVKGPCIGSSGKPDKADRRAAGRPACRRSRVLEHRDADGAPRYACLFTDRAFESRTPLPLIVFLHSETDAPTAVHKKTRLRLRYGKLDLTGDPQHAGFAVLAPQARAFKRRLRWEVDYTGADNIDAAVIDHFVDVLVTEGVADRRQIYAVGDSRGGQMAALYTYLRPDRIAAFGAYGANASQLRWSCPEEQPPAAILYRSCDYVVPCADVERWLSLRAEQRAATFSMRLGGGKATEPSCVVTKSRCRQKKGTANHARWPKPREREMLEYLSRFSLDVTPGP